jgi:hypothetical protein
LVANTIPQRQPAVTHKPPASASAPQNIFSVKAFACVDSLLRARASNQVALLFAFSFADNHRQGEARRSAISTLANPAAVPVTGGYRNL